MTNILGVSGKLQSGKTTSAQFLMASTLASLGIIDAFKFDEGGQLIVKSGDDAGPSDLLCPENQEFYQNMWLEDYGKPVSLTTKTYSFADDLKSLCINILGLTYEQCYGTNEEKDSITNLRWENVAGIVPVHEINDTNKGWIGLFNGIPHYPGYMTGRQVMQHIGTEWFRRIYPDVWVDSTIRRINQEQADLALIADTRFPNEVLGIQKHGGKVVRLLRNPHDNKHESEIALDDFDGFDHIIDNRNMTIQETNAALEEYLRSIGWFPSYRLEVTKGG